MPLLRLTMTIAAPIEQCFDLSRSIDLHQRSLDASEERAVAGVTSGLIGLGESVMWEARHFGIVQRLSTRITAYNRPRHFRDTMESGAFRRFDHDHYFEADGQGATIVRDDFDYDAPLGILGLIAEIAFLSRYMRRLLTDRNETIKRVAESEEWREFLPE